MSDSRDKNKFMVRMPEGMRDRIAELAKQNNRSMNAEIIARLAASLEPVGTRHSDLQEALKAHGGDMQALLASEALRMNQLLEEATRTIGRRKR